MFSGDTWTSDSALVSAARTPKSPHPGHQIGLSSVLKSLAESFCSARGTPASAVAMLGPLREGADALLDLGHRERHAPGARVDRHPVARDVEPGGGIVRELGLMV